MTVESAFVQRVVVDAHGKRLANANIAKDRMVALVQQLAIFILAVLRLRRVGQIEDENVAGRSGQFVVLEFALLTERFEFIFAAFGHTVNKRDSADQELFNARVLVGYLLEDPTLGYHVPKNGIRVILISFKCHLLPRPEIRKLERPR